MQKQAATQNMTKVKQRYKNPNSIEKVSIQLRFPDYSQINKIKRGRKSNIVEVVWKYQNMNNAKPYGAIIIIII